MKKTRHFFYLGLALAYPLFFLLHWNGLFSATYPWALVLVDGTHNLIPQLIFSLLSSAVIFGFIMLLFESFRSVSHRLRVV